MSQVLTAISDYLVSLALFLTKQLYPVHEIFAVEDAVFFLHYALTTSEKFISSDMHEDGPNTFYALVV